MIFLIIYAIISVLLMFLTFAYAKRINNPSQIVMALIFSVAWPAALAVMGVLVLGQSLVNKLTK